MEKGWQRRSFKIHWTRKNKKDQKKEEEKVTKKGWKGVTTNKQPQCKINVSGVTRIRRDFSANGKKKTKMRNVLGFILKKKRERDRGVKHTEFALKDRLRGEWAGAK